MTTSPIDNLGEFELPELAAGLAWIRGALEMGGSSEGAKLIPSIDQAIEACSNENRGDALRHVAQLFKRLATMLEQGALEADQRRRLQ